jgi:uncharacterized protein YjbI with pentapeptide repeats/uncharacterized membrane-anchored protein YhcB (DUF1043 family)
MMADNTPQTNEKPQSTTVSTDKHWWESDSTGGLGCATLLLIGAVFMLYQVDWSGLRGKNVWDWLQLIIVPLVLAGGGFLLQRFESDRLKQQEAFEKEREKHQQALEKERIEAQVEREREQAKNNLMDNIFQSYLDDISTLLIDKRLQTMLDIVTAERLREEAEKKAAKAKENGDEQAADSANGTEQETKAIETLPAIEIDNGKLAEAKAVVTVARARTVTALRSLDVDRRNLLANFLRETGLVTGEQGSLLVGIQLEKVDLSETHLYDFNLSQANLYQANLSHAYLYRANLSHAMLMEANLNHLRAYGTNLSYTMLNYANLLHAELQNANLSHASIQIVNLSYAYLDNANLSHAILYQANLSHVNLEKANLRKADFEEVIFDTKIILPEAEWQRWDEDLEEGIYSKYWSTDTDITRYTNPEHPDFWEPEYLKPGYEGDKPTWVTVQETGESSDD